MNSNELKKRTPEQLVAAIATLLETSEPLTRTQIMKVVRASKTRLDPILETMRESGVLASFEGKGQIQRGARRDIFWCPADRLPAPEAKVAAFRGAEILAGFQIAARAYVAQGQRV